MEPVRVIVITGPVGAGKTATAEQVSEQLGAAGLRHACLDMDRLRWVYPEPEGDRFGERLGMANLAAVWPNLRDVGVRVLVLADVVEDPAERRTYEAAVPGAEVTIVRLRVSAAELDRRLRDREAPASLAWYLHRAGELTEIMTDAHVGDIVLDVDGHSVAEVAAAVIAATGLEG